MTEGSLITDELRALIGVPWEPAVFKIEEGAIQRYAQAIGDPNPMFNDPEYARMTRHGRLLAPPGFTGWPVREARAKEKLFDTLIKAGGPPRILDAGVEFEFFETIGAGDILTATLSVAGITERDTRLGRTVFTTAETSYVNQKGDLVLRSRSTLMQF